jgi:hypothetical protein
MAVTITTTTVSDIESKKAISGGTVSGSTDEEGEYLPLVDHVLKNKFKLYNRSRQRITSSVKNKGTLKPFQLFTDSKQSDKPFVLGNIVYRPITDMYEVELFEYDNTTNINLVP